MQDGKVERPDGETTDRVLSWLKLKGTAEDPGTIKRALELPFGELSTVCRACEQASRLNLVFKIADYPREIYQWNAGDETPEAKGKRLRRVGGETYDAVLKFLESARECSWFDILDALNGVKRERRKFRASMLPHQAGTIRDAVDAAWIVGLIDWETKRGRACYRWLDKVF